MNAQVRDLKYSELRQSYQTVKDFIEGETRATVPSLNTRIDADLGIAGDDNLQLIQNFADRYNLDFEGFNYSKHFQSEGELFGSGAVLMSMLYLILMLPLKLIELISFNRIKLIHYEEKDQRSDLTFRDMLTWYVEGGYNSDTK